MEKNKAAQLLGRLGGLKGGKARAERLSAAERRAIAKKAAITRWGRKSDDELTLTEAKQRKGKDHVR